MSKMTSTVAGLLLVASFSPQADAQAEAYASVYAPTLERLSSLRGSNVHRRASGRWIQPLNHPEQCQLYTWDNQDPASKHEWHGDCRNGRATGLGVVVATSSQLGTWIWLEEISGGIDGGGVIYRAVKMFPRGPDIEKGRITRSATLTSATSIVTTPGGNRSVNLFTVSCSDGECTQRMVDPLTGSMTYSITGTSGYMIHWLDQRADNQPLFTRRGLSMDGGTPFEKIVTGGGVLDVFSDKRSGQTGWVVFTDEVNAALALPVEQFSAISNDLQLAVQESDEKFASVFDRLCVDQRDLNIRTLCDPSGLIPKEEELAAARQELNQNGRTQQQQFNNALAAIQTREAQAQADQMQQHQLQAQQEALAAERRRIASQEALRRGFEAINQAGQDAQRAAQQMIQSSEAPQVLAPTLGGPSIVHCRTIGYITTCN